MKSSITDQFISLQEGCLCFKNYRAKNKQQNWHSDRLRMIGLVLLKLYSSSSGPISKIKKTKQIDHTN